MTQQNEIVPADVYARVGEMQKSITKMQADVDWGIGVLWIMVYVGIGVVVVVLVLIAVKIWQMVEVRSVMRKNIGLLGMVKEFLGVIREYIDLDRNVRDRLAARLDQLDMTTATAVKSATDRSVAEVHKAVSTVPEKTAVKVMQKITEKEGGDSGVLSFPPPDPEKQS